MTWIDDLIAWFPTEYVRMWQLAGILLGVFFIGLIPYYFVKRFIDQRCYNFELSRVKSPVYVCDMYGYFATLIVSGIMTTLYSLVFLVLVIGGFGFLVFGFWATWISPVWLIVVVISIVIGLFAVGTWLVFRQSPQEKAEKTGKPKFLTQDDMLRIQKEDEMFRQQHPEYY